MSKQRSQRRRRTNRASRGRAIESTESRAAREVPFDHGVKLVAIVSMVIDHVGMIFFPQIEALRLVGRLALPLFAYLVGMGVERSSNREAYLCRLLAMFLISQFPYGLFVGTKLNIFLPLLAGALATKYMIDGRWGWFLGIAVAYAGFAYQHPISYSYIGPLLVVVFAAARSHVVLATLVVTGIYFADAQLVGSLFSRMAVFVAPLVPVVVHFVHWRSRSKWRWAYWIYPGNFAVFYAIAWHTGLVRLLP